MQCIAITAEGPTMQDLVDSRFGRAAGFIIVQLDTLKTHYIDNGASQIMSQGAGIQATEMVAEAGAQAVLTGVVGPKATAALEAVGIAIYEGYENMTVADAITRFTAQQEK